MLDNASTAELIEALQHHSSEIRAHAAAILRRKPDKRAVDALINALKDGSAAVRDYAASALGATGDTRAVEPLIQCFFDPKDHVRRKVIAALVSIGIPAVQPLIEFLPVIDKRPDSKDVKRKWDVVAMLGDIGDRQAVDMLLSMLKTAVDTGDANGGGIIVAALEDIGDKRVVLPLIAVLQDKTAPARPDAARTLGSLRDLRALEPLIECLQDKDVFVRHRAAWALGNIGDSRAVEPLIAALADNSTLFDKQIEEGVSDPVLRGLKKLESLSSPIKPVPVCEVSAEALRKIGTPAALEAVKSWQKTQQR